MSENGENSFTPNTEPEEKQEDIKKIKVRLSLFFDGTLNNRVNIANRENADKDPQAKVIYEKYGKEDNSYEGDHTNISKMEKCIGDAENYDVTLSVYTEGPGTDDMKGDHIRGYALGTGSTGVIKKVEKGIEEAAGIIKASVSNAQTIIELVTIDVFGFSRGAAGARLCIHEVLNGKQPLKDRMIDNGYKVGRVHVWFAGLYDTVSSHGVIYSNDVSDLKLRSVSLAKRTVQLAAAEEHRKNFSLTDIASAGSFKGLQLFLPGVHSDIGGGYRDNVEETGMGIYHTLSLQAAEHERKKLIELGWYRDNEIKVVHFPPLTPDAFDHYVVETSRQGIKNTYSRIPLHLMAKYSIENGIKIKSKLFKKDKIPGALTKVESQIKQYIQNIGTSSKPEDWIENIDVWLKELRNGYLHFSAKLKFAHTARFAEHKRYRKIYHG